MTTERVAAARRGCKRTKVKITQKPALARKSQEAVLKTSSGAAPCGVNRTPGPAGLNFKSDLNSTALRPCCGDRSCMWSRRVTWEKPGGVSGGGCGPRDSSGSGILDRTRSPQVRPPAGFRPPQGPAERACPPRTVGKMNQDHPRQVCRPGLRTKWTANISCEDDKKNVFKATGTSLVAQWLGTRVPDAAARAQSLVGDSRGPACCN